MKNNPERRLTNNRITDIQRRFEENTPNQIALTNQSFSFGFRNLGNTCYMNAAFQAFFSINIIKDEFLNKIQNFPILMREQEMYFYNKCQQLVLEMILGQNKANFDRYHLELNRECLKNCNLIQQGNQEDANEFLIWLITNISDAYLVFNYIDQQIHINHFINLFMINTTRTRVCLQNNTEHQDQDISLFIQLTVSNLTLNLEECFRTSEYMRAEVIKNFNCDNCRLRGDSRIIYTITRFPRILMIKLRRTYFDQNKGQQINKRLVNIPEQLNIDQLFQINTPRNLIYNLASICFKSGNTLGGHWIGNIFIFCNNS